MPKPTIDELRKKKQDTTLPETEEQKPGGFTKWKQKFATYSATPTETDSQAATGYSEWKQKYGASEETMQGAKFNAWKQKAANLYSEDWQNSVNDAFNQLNSYGNDYNNLVNQYVGNFDGSDLSREWDTEGYQELQTNMHALLKNIGLTSARLKQLGFNDKSEAMQQISRLQEGLKQISRGSKNTLDFYEAWGGQPQYSIKFNDLYTQGGYDNVDAVVKDAEIQAMNAQRKLDRIASSNDELRQQWADRVITQDELTAQSKKNKERADEQKKILEEAQMIIDSYALYATARLTQEPDFEEKSKYQSTATGEDGSNPVTGYINLDKEYGDWQYELINRNEDVEKARVSNSVRDNYDSGYLSRLTDDEIAVYNYLYAADKDKANNYLENITPLLYQRTGEQRAAADANYGHGVDIVAAFKNGLYSTIESTVALLRGDGETPMSMSEWENAYLMGNSSGFKKWVYGAAASAGQMVPSMVIGGAASMIGGPAAGRIASSFTTALTSGAGAYQEALRGGMSVEDAKKYALSSGLSEGFLEWVLSGIPGLKGWGVEELGEKLASKVGSALGRWGIKFGTSIASEVLEENIQNYLEPLFVTMITGEDYDAPGWDDFVDTTMSTLLLTGAMNLANAPSEISGESQTILMEAEEKFARAAMTFDPDSKIYEAGLAVLMTLNEGNIVTGQEFRNLISGLGVDEQTMKSIRSGKMTSKELKNAFTAKTDADTSGNATTQTNGIQRSRGEWVTAYVENGMTQEFAEMAADSIVKAQNGEKLTQKDIRRLRLNTDAGAKMLSEALGVDVERATNNTDSAQQIYRAAVEQAANARETGSATSLTDVTDGRTEASTPTTEVQQNTQAAAKMQPNEKLRDATQVTANGESATMTGIAYNDGDVQAIVRQEDGTLHKENLQDVGGLSDERRGIITRIATVFRSAAARVYAIHEAGQSVDQYLQGAETVFEVAQNSKKSLQEVLPELKNMKSVQGLSDFQIEQIWNAGKSAVDNGESNVYSNSDAKTKNNTKTKEDTDNEGTGLRVREGGKRSDGKSSGGESRTVEKTAGGNQSREGQPGKSGKTGSVQSGTSKTDARKVSAKELGISQGSKQKNLTQVDETYSKDTKRAHKFARENGMQVVFFAGENLRISTENGEIEARAYHIGNKLFVRADHPQFSAYQLTRHEHGHVLIAEGRLDAQSVHDRMVKIAGEENIDWISDIYSQAYEEAQLTPEQVWEEYLCDSYADMNIFADLPLGEDVGAFLRETGRVIAEDTILEGVSTGDTTRSDASIELKELAELRKENDQLQKDFDKAQDNIQKLKAQFKLTKVPTARLSDIDAMTRRMLKGYQSKAKFGDVRNSIKALADSIFQGNENTSWNAIKEQASEIASGIVREASVLTNAEEMETYRGIKQYLRSQKLLFSESSDIADYKEFRKKYGRRLRLVESGGLPIDVAWMELQQRYGEYYFPDGVLAQSDMAQYMAELLNRMQPIYENPHSLYLAEATEYCANEIIAEILSERIRETAPTFADKQKAKLDAERAKSKEALKQERAKSKQAVADATLAGQMAQGRKDAAENRKLRETIEKNKTSSKEALMQEREKSKRKLNEAIEKNNAKAQRALTQEQRKREKAVASLKSQIERLSRKIESGSVKNLRKQVEKAVKSLTDKLVTNSAKKHVPEVLKKPIAEFLQSLDFSSKRMIEGKGETKNDLKHVSALTRINQILQNQANNPMSYDDNTNNMFLDLSEKTIEEIQKYIDTAVSAAAEGADTVTNRVYAMDSAQLKRLNFILTTLNHCVSKVNEYYAEGRTGHLQEDAKSSMTDMNSLGTGKESGKFRKFLLWDNTLPVRAFERFGRGGKHIFEILMDGQDKLTKNLKTIMDFKESVWKDADVKKWRNELHKFTLSSKKEVTMTTTQIMSLYCLNKRKQAGNHLFGGGIHIEDIKTKKNGAIRQVERFLLTEEDVSDIVSVLDERQKEVADKIQEFMNTVLKGWGNETTMRRFGYNGFTEDWYFPIESDEDVIRSGDKQMRENSLFRLANLGWTKSVNPNANNAIMVRDIFNVFSNHASDMAKYNSMVLPLLDAMKWYNYSETVKHENGNVETETVKTAMKRAYGSAAKNYFMTLIEDLNGKSDAGRESSGWAGIVSRYKSAATGWNLRVALLQPTAWFRAGAVLDYKYLFGALPMTGGINEMLEHSEVAQWKDMGFPNINVGTPIRKRLSGDITWADKVRDSGTHLSGFGDKATWGAIWNACKLEQKTKYGLKGDALTEATKKRFREVIYATQVTDSTLTRSHNMRSKSSILVEATSFMSEPTMTYNMLMSTAMKFAGDSARYGKAAAFKMNKKSIVRTFAVWSFSTVVTAVVESIIDAARDDDDYKTYLEKVSENFFGEYFIDGNLGSDMLVLNSLPFLRDIVSRIQGYDNSSMYLEPILSGIDFAEQMIDVAKNGLGNKTVYGLIYKGIQVASSLSGIPAGSAMRDMAALWNNTLGTVIGKKLKTYDPGDKSEIRQAYKDCYLSDEEAQELLLSKDTEIDDAEEAYWTVQSWKYESKFGRLSKALAESNEAEILAAKDEMLAHGYDESEFVSKVKSEIKSQLFPKEDDEIPMLSDQAENLLVSYCGLSREEAKTAMEAWELNDTWSQDKETEDLSITDDSYAKWKEYCKPVNVSIKTFMEAKEYKSSLVGTGEGKEEVMQYIHSLSLSKQQKDALYFALGYQKSELAQGIADSDNAKILSVKADMLKQGKEEKDFVSKVKTEVKKQLFDEYETMDATRAEKLLMTYCGLNAEDAGNTIEVWKLNEADEDLNITVEGYAKWKEYCKPAGVAIETLEKVKDYKSSLQNTGKGKKEVLQYIHSLPLSSAQKDAIYYSLGYKESKIGDAPWK